jgi:redox-sensitive bicupin YhaK (pirin superfamily)
MLQLRKSESRGLGAHGWLNSRHTFSFADYYDPKSMGFRSLRVINEDRIDGGTGFGRHPHRDMEIISYVVKGALEHQDSMGNKAIIRPGEVQKLSAGTGISHSEYNHMPKEESHFFQIWIVPKEKGGAPSYGQKSFEDDLKNKKLVLAISNDGRDGSIAIKQDADMYISKLKENDTAELNLRKGRGAWVQVVAGKLKVNGQEAATGDGIAIETPGLIKIEAKFATEFILFDLV